MKMTTDIIERLRNAAMLAVEDDVIMLAAANEIERLRQVCRNVYEVWAGSEGIPVPETAPEAYLLSLIEQMRDESKEGLKDCARQYPAMGVIDDGQNNIQRESNSSVSPVDGQGKNTRTSAHDGAPTPDKPMAWMIQYEGQCMGFVPDQKPNTVPVYLHPPRNLDSGCQLAGLGRDDCEHAIGLPGIPITGQHDGEDTTVDANGKPNGWCWYCWQAHQIKELRKPRKFGYDAFNRWWIRQDDLKYGTAYESALAAAKWALENMK